jgi:hypothetical protein
MGNCINKEQIINSQSVSSCSSSKYPSLISVQSSKTNEDFISFETHHIERTLELNDSSSNLDLETDDSTFRGSLIERSAEPKSRTTQVKKININKRSSNLDIYQPQRIKQFFKQDVEKIRQSRVRFVDKTFPPSIQIITKNVQSEFAQQLFNNYQIQNRYTLHELGQRIRWQSTKVHIYF